ncbi:unnamed protein product [Cylindrotheca closterium]|uniref:Uncharacterized protein n=1 Tax=Cylindrotheca closterium TaxID=2856 RepID=A0AAD2FH00_9STRA|nr:unnamed protein product [Cylindrotheca closterium]
MNNKEETTADCNINTANLSTFEGNGKDDLNRYKRRGALAAALLVLGITVVVLLVLHREDDSNRTTGSFTIGNDDADNLRKKAYEGMQGAAHQLWNTSHDDDVGPNNRDWKEEVDKSLKERGLYLNSRNATYLLNARGKTLTIGDDVEIREFDENEERDCSELPLQGVLQAMRKVGVLQYKSPDTVAEWAAWQGCLIRSHAGTIMVAG